MKSQLGDYEFLSRYQMYDSDLQKKVWSILPLHIQKRLTMKMEGRMK